MLGRKPYIARKKDEAREMISSKQAQLARIMLDLSQAELAKKLGWAHQTISKIEKGSVNPPASRIKELEEFYENAGIEFLDGNGVRQSQTLIQTLNGHEGFKRFLDDVYETAKEQGGEFCISNVDERNWTKWAGQEKWDAHEERMKAIHGQFHDKIIIKEDDWYFLASEFAEYRWMPKKLFNEQTLYAYGDKLAFLDFSHDDVQIFIVRKKEFSDGFRVLFNAAWEGVALIPDENKRISQ